MWLAVQLWKEPLNEDQTYAYIGKQACLDSETRFLLYCAL